MTDPEQKLIQVESLTKLYGDLAAVRDLAFSVAAGEVLGLVGPNGAGKTTTLRSLAGIITPPARHDPDRRARPAARSRRGQARARVHSRRAAPVRLPDRAASTCASSRASTACADAEARAPRAARRARARRPARQPAGGALARHEAEAGDRLRAAARAARAAPRRAAHRPRPARHPAHEGTRSCGAREAGAAVHPELAPAAPGRGGVHPRAGAPARASRRRAAASRRSSRSAPSWRVARSRTVFIALVGDREPRERSAALASFCSCGRRGTGRSASSGACAIRGTRSPCWPASPISCSSRATRAPATESESALAPASRGALLALGVPLVTIWAWVIRTTRARSRSPPPKSPSSSPRRSAGGAGRFKLARAQLVVLLNMLIWAVIIDVGRPGMPTWMRAVSVWCILSTLHLHRLGARSTRASLGERAQPFRRLAVAGLLTRGHGADRRCPGERGTDARFRARDRRAGRRHSSAQASCRCPPWSSRPCCGGAPAWRAGRRMGRGDGCRRSACCSCTTSGWCAPTRHSRKRRPKHRSPARRNWRRSGRRAGPHRSGVVLPALARLRPGRPSRGSRSSGRTSPWCCAGAARACSSSMFGGAARRGGGGDGTGAPASRTWWASRS